MHPLRHLTCSFLVAGLWSVTAQARVSRHFQLRQGTVIYTTQERVYLNRGADEGLAPGQTLRFSARQKCEVEHVGDHVATCKGESVRAIIRRGQKVQVPGPKRELTPPPLDEPLSRVMLRNARQTLAATKFQKVSFTGPSRARRPQNTVRVSAQAFGVSGSLAAERTTSGIAMSVTDKLTDNITVRAHASARRWFSSEVPRRFRNQYENQFDIHALYGTYNHKRWQAHLGRFIPYNIPGIQLLDGAQITHNHVAFFDEFGVFGGATPDFVTMVPSADRWTAGLHYRLATREGSLNAGHAARLAWVMDNPIAGWWAVHPQLWLGKFGGANIQLSSLWDASNSVWHMYRVDAGTPLGKSVDLAASLRGRSANGARSVYSSIPAVAPGGTLHTDLVLTWRTAPWLEMRLVGDNIKDAASDNERLVVGPDLIFPRLLRSRMRMALGYREERGWLSGRSAYAEQSLHVGESGKLRARLSFASLKWDHQAAPLTTQEWGLTLGGNLALTSFLWLDFSIGARAGFVSPFGFGIEGERFGFNSFVGLTAGR